MDGLPFPVAAQNARKAWPYLIYDTAPLWRLGQLHANIFGCNGAGQIPPAPGANVMPWSANSEARTQDAFCITAAIAEAGPTITDCLLHV